MRVSVIKGDPDEIANGEQLEVRLNGHPVRDVLTADERGFILRYRRSWMGELVANDSKELETEVVRGKVEIIAPPGWTPLYINKVMLPAPEMVQ